MNSLVEQNLETLRAMRRQEELGYSVVDYLSCLPKTNAALEAPVDADCRFLMAKWCCEIASFCNYQKETVAIAMNCLDRFVATPTGYEILMDRNLYQLAAMTALYSSVKIHEQEVLNPRLVAELSRGKHSPQAVEAMEAKMLQAIQWRVNPPTALSFVRSMIDLVPDHRMNTCEKETAIDIAKLQIEMTVNEYDFCTKDTSSVAFASTLNALESVVAHPELIADFESTIANIMMLDDSCVRDLRVAIYELMNGNDAINKMQTNAKTTSTKAVSSCGGPVAAGNDIQSSPRTVATAVAQQ